MMATNGSLLGVGCTCVLHPVVSGSSTEHVRWAGNLSGSGKESAGTMSVHMLGIWPATANMYNGCWSGVTAGKEVSCAHNAGTTHIWYAVYIV